MKFKIISFTQTTEAVPRYERKRWAELYESKVKTVCVFQQLGVNDPRHTCEILLNEGDPRISEWYEAAKREAVFNFDITIEK